MDDWTENKLSDGKLIGTFNRTGRNIFVKNKSIYNQFFLHAFSQIYLPIWIIIQNLNKPEHL